MLPSSSFFFDEIEEYSIDYSNSITHFLEVLDLN